MSNELDDKSINENRDLKKREDFHQLVRRIREAAPKVRQTLRDLDRLRLERTGRDKS